MADPLQDTLIREIDEDLRREKFAKLWKSYGGYVAAAAVSLVVGVAGYQGWYTYDLNRREADGEELVKAMTLSGDDPTAALEALRSIAGSDHGYAILARLQEAALLAKGGDREAALALYQRLEAEVDDPIYRDLAVVLGASLRLENAGSPVDRDWLVQKLQPIAAEGNPWRFSARELIGILALRAGDTAKAGEVFSSLAADLQAPPEMRARATELLAVAQGK